MNGVGWSWIPPTTSGEWPVIRTGISRFVPDVSATPKLTESAKWRYALRDDTYIDHRLTLLTGRRIRARLHNPPISASTQLVSQRTRSLTTGSACLDAQHPPELNPTCITKSNPGDISVLREPAQSLAASIPSATAQELHSLPGAQCNCAEGTCAAAGRHCDRVVFMDHRDRPLMYSTFFWDARVHSALIPHAIDHIVLPSTLGRVRFEHSRRILSVVYGPPGHSRPIWGREYVFKRRRKPFLVVQDVFAEGISRYLGPVTPPLFCDTDS